MRIRRWLLGLAGLVLLGIAAWRILSATSGLEVIRAKAGSAPVTFMMPAGIDPASRPIVLIAHGFAGSERLMRGFALTLAHAGFVTASWDFAGHGANPLPLTGSRDSGALDADALAVLEEAQRRGLGNASKVAILGHSMGSGVALRFGQDRPDTAATIAISPVGVAVTPELPRNLLLMAGSLEPNFVENARSLLTQAGGEGGEAAQGKARRLVIIPGVEHITILFAPRSHLVVRQWLEASFGVQSGSRDFVDRRAAWLGIGILGVIWLTLGWAPRSQSWSLTQKTFSFWQSLMGLAGGAMGGTLLLWLAGLAGLNISQFLGMLVGGYLFLWFGVSGLLALLILRPPLRLPAWKELFQGLLIFALLWGGVGLLGDPVWLPWLLIPPRLALWLPGALGCFPWFLAVSLVSIGHASSGWKRVIAGWLLQTVVIVAALLLALRLTPALFFILLILPLFPLVLGIHAAASALQRSCWVFAISAALFTAWMVAAVFPLS